MRTSCLWTIPFVSLLLSLSAKAQSTLCDPSPTRLCLQSGRIAVEVDFQNFAGNKFSVAPSQAAGPAKKVKFGEDTGLFWFVDQESLELLVKVLDGRSINGHFWVFLASTSNFDFTLTVQDLETGTRKEYRNPTGLFASFTDVRALKAPSDSLDFKPGLVDEWQSVSLRRARPTDSDGPEGSSLHLFKNRFEISVEWKDFSAHSGSGLPISFSDSTGAFYLFSENSLDLLVRVVDGREKNGNFWFFLGSVANVEYRLRITDTLTGDSKLFFNPLSQLLTVGDNGPFVPNIFLAQFGSGGGFGTKLFLVNMSKRFPADITLKFFSEAGTEALPPSLEARMGSTMMDPRQPIELPPRGSLAVSTSSTGQQLWLGSVAIDTNQPLVAQARYEIDGIGACATGAGQLTKSALIPVRRRAGTNNSGLAIQNAYAFATAVSLELLDVTGSQIPGGTAELNLSPHERTSKFIDELFPDLNLDNFQGTIFLNAQDKVVSVISLELGSERGDFTSISAVPLN